MTVTREKIRAGIYGALIGDAVGVPYEFKPPAQIPPYDDIDMVPPTGYKRSWARIPVGVYSDDGSQVLCLVEHLATSTFDEHAFHALLTEWLNNGYLSSNGVMFDCGNQTMAALKVSVEEVHSSLNEDRFNGNGSLMRSIPVALLCDDPDEICEISFLHSGVTHPHIRSKICCALYSLIVHCLLHGHQLHTALVLAPNHLRKWLRGDRPALVELSYVLDCAGHQLNGTGYVVDSLWSAINAVQRGRDYADTIKLAIQYGSDTDTTACIAGGLAAIIHGVDSIPPTWLELLQGKEQVERLLSLINNSNTGE